MNFDLTDDQRLIQETARDFLQKTYTSEVIRSLGESDQGYTEEQWQAMSELGWHGLAVSEEAGGQGLGTIELAVVMEQLGHALAPTPYFSNTFAALQLEALGSGAQKEKYLAPLAAGEKRGTMALWDAGAGWDPDDIRLEAVASNGGFGLDGRKAFVLDAAAADFLIVAARDGGSFIVEREADGVSVSPTPTMDSTRRQYAVTLDGVRVSGGAALTDDAGARGLARDRACIALAAELTGVAQRAMEMAVSYATDRKQFGRPIGSYQAVSHRCAQMLLEVEGARATTYYAAWCADNDPANAGLAASMAKAYASDAAWRVTGSSLQVHGGIGFTWEHDLHFWLKRARTMAAYLGDARWHRERVASLTLAA